MIPAAEAGSDLPATLTALGTILGTMATVVAGWLLNRKTGKSREAGRKSEVDGIKEAVTMAVGDAVEKIDKRVELRLTTMQRAVDDGFKTFDHRLDRMNVSLTEVRTATIGVDGRNGMRGTLEDLKGEVAGIKERELELLTKKADLARSLGPLDVGVADRRVAASG